MLCVVFVFVHHPEIDTNVNVMLRDLLCPELLKHRAYIFQISKPQSFDPGWNSNLQPSDLWAST